MKGRNQGKRRSSQGSPRSSSQGSPRGADSNSPRGKKHSYGGKPGSHGGKSGGHGGKAVGAVGKQGVPRHDGRSSQSQGNRAHGSGSGPSSGRHGARHERGGEAHLNSRDRWVIGIHSCEETLKVRPHTIRELWLREDYEDSLALRSIAELAAAHDLTIKSRTPGQLDALGSGHQGVALATVENPEIDWAALADPTPKIVLILDGIEDPHNLGAMLRTGWLTGVVGVLIPDDRAVGITPTVCKVASGGAEHVAVESFTNLASAIKQLKDAGFWVYGLSEKGTGKPWDFKLPEKVAWVIGSEGGGMRITTERACDELVRIPQVTGGSSYNAAIAAGMALIETCRQFGKPE